MKSAKKEKPHANKFILYRLGGKHSSAFNDKSVIRLNGFIRTKVKFHTWKVYATSPTVSVNH